MRPDDALYLPDGDPDSAVRFIATPWTRGPWDMRTQHGGPPTALMVRAMERRAAELGDFQLSRVTADFLRAIPIDRCHLDVALTRPGRRALGLECTLAVDGRACARASALFIRRAAVPVPPELLLADEPVDPTRLREHVFDFFPDPVGYHSALELRLGTGPFEPGSGDGWLRLRGQLVAGEAPSPAQRVAVAADAINGVGFALDIARWTFVNADLTVYLHRELEGEYVRLRTRHVSQPDGRGLVDAALGDRRGPIGRALEAQVLELRQPVSKDS
ncbi:thioesterase family protein [Nannocystis radixulma]|uniref:Thioesterase family protein n=1 Tax=Nannocystis radixulma TaxID=2995305 RepID=A0ABT5BQ11_9BACT|nr:thioesterase family protein [Nannocystis radixulma]MDC0675082.1 thioesterase family protein [Nannocystis radixulma]